MDGLHRTLIWLGVALLCTTGAHSQSLSGLRIGDPVTATDRIGSAPVTVERSGLFTIAKWLLADGNELSVTSQVSDGKIVFIESDWGGDPNGTYTDFLNLYFGKTTLGDIENRLGSNGTVFFSDHLIWFSSDGSYMARSSSYVVAADIPIIVSFITHTSRMLFDEAVKIEKMKGSRASNIAMDHSSILYSISLGDPQYLFNTWGPHNVAHPPLRAYLFQAPQQEHGRGGEGFAKAPTPETTSGKADEVKLADHGGTYLVPVLVNGRLVLDFVLDSGASEVQIPDDVFRTLYRTETVSDADFLGTETYTLADGSKVPSARFMLHSLVV